VELLRAQIAFVLTRSNDVPGMLLNAAKTLAPLDAALARGTYLEAIEAAVAAGPLGQGRGVREVAEAARAAPAPPVPPTPVDMLLDGLVTRFTQGYEASVPGLRRALEAMRDQRLWSDGRRELWLANFPRWTGPGDRHSARGCTDSCAALDQAGCDLVASLPEEQGLGLAIANRLRRAAGPRPSE
jgi:hypothetical protein